MLFWIYVEISSSGLCNFQRNIYLCIFWKLIFSIIFELECISICYSYIFKPFTLILWFSMWIQIHYTILPFEIAKRSKEMWKKIYITLYMHFIFIPILQICEFNNEVILFLDHRHFILKVFIWNYYYLKNVYLYKV